MFEIEAIIDVIEQQSWDHGQLQLQLAFFANTEKVMKKKKQEKKH